MRSVHRPALEGPAAFGCAQAGCQECLERLLRQHTRLVHWVIRQSSSGTLSYDELLQEGRIALWRAILHYDPARQTTFATYAVPAIQHGLWSAVARAQRREGWLAPVVPVDPAAWAERAWQRTQVRAALAELLAHLPEQRAQVIVAAYGLDGQPPLSLAAIGRLCGVSGERVRQWRNDALVLLRMPVLSGQLRRLCDQNDRHAYQQAEVLNRAWLRRRRGGRR
jgi:RNA polymerase primary sigma factor